MRIGDAKNEKRQNYRVSYSFSFAMAIGGAAMLTILYLEGTSRIIALAVIIVATIGSWNYLRKRFGRYD